jgi:hypothetical protein
MYPNIKYFKNGVTLLLLKTVSLSTGTPFLSTMNLVKFHLIQLKKCKTFINKILGSYKPKLIFTIDKLSTYKSLQNSSTNIYIYIYIYIYV